MKRNVNVFGINDKRGRVETSPDPFPQPLGLKTALCEGCRSVYHHKSWHQDPESYKLLSEDPQTARILCPACQRQQEKLPEGILTLQGDYLWEHEEEIRNLLHNRAQEIHNRNPLQRIMRMEKVEERLVIETTEHKLAEQLGRTLVSAHQGELKSNWVGQHHTCRFDWQRDE
jgi:NMD protein affecting ribosome stability and mRNA decay